MPRKPRFFLPDIPAHIVQRGHSREPVFFEDNDYHAYLGWMEEAAKRYHCDIGGATADAVGERLKSLSAQSQVLVVTHSPQVASRGVRHWRVSKSSEQETVRTDIETLTDDARKEEIARMLAGAEVTEEARAAADSLLQGTGR